MSDSVAPSSYFLEGRSSEVCSNRNRILLSIQRLEKLDRPKENIEWLMRQAVYSVREKSRGSLSLDGNLERVEKLLLLFREKKIQEAKLLFSDLPKSLKDKIIAVFSDRGDSFEDLISYRNQRGDNLLEAVLDACYKGDFDCESILIEDFTKQDILLEYECASKMHQDIAKMFLTDTAKGEALLWLVGDERDRIEIAKLCAAQNGGAVAYAIQKFGITDQKELIEILKLCAHQNTEKCAKYIQNFRITDQFERAKIAKLLAKEDGWRTAVYIGNFGITDQRELLEIAKLCAHENGRATAYNIQEFGILDEEDRAEIAKLCSYQSAEATAESIKNFEIDDESELVEIAKSCAQTDGGSTAAHIKAFDIVEESDRIEIAKLCAMENGEQTAWHIKEFGITNQQELFEIAKLCAFQNGIGTANNIQRFRIRDQGQRLEIAKICAQQVGKKIVKMLDHFGISDDKIEKDLDLYATFFEVERTGDLSPITQAALLEYSKTIFENHPLFNQDRFKGWDHDPLALSLARKLSKMCLTLLAFDGRVDEATWNVLYELSDLRNTGLFTYCMSQIEELVKERKWGSYLEHCAKPILYLPGLMFAKLLAVDEDISPFLERIETLKRFFKDGPRVEQWLLMCKELDQTSLSASEKAAVLEKLFSNLSGSKRAQIKEFSSRINCLLALFFMRQGDRLNDFPSLDKDVLGGEIVAALYESGQVDLRGVEELADKWDKKIFSTRAPNALLIYLGSLKKVGDPDLLDSYTQFIKEILEGVEREARYERDTPHIKKISQAHPKLWSDWKQPGKFEIATGTSEKKGTFSLKEFLIQKLRDGHFPEKFRELKSYLEGRKEKKPLGEGAEESKGEEYDIEADIIELCENPILTAEEIVRRLERVFKEGGRDLRGSELKNDLEGLIQSLTTTQKEGSRLRIIDSDDWVDLLMCGTEILGSCQRIDGNPNFNKGLLAYVIDGKNRILAIKDEEGKIVARSLFRLLWNETEKRAVLYQDTIYPYPCPIEYVSILEEFAKKRALELEAPLYKSGGHSSDAPTIVSLGSSVPYEYEDGAEGLTNGLFTITNPQLVPLESKSK